MEEHVEGRKRGGGRRNHSGLAGSGLGHRVVPPPPLVGNTPPPGSPLHVQEDFPFDESNSVVPSEATQRKSRVAVFLIE